MKLALLFVTLTLGALQAHAEFTEISGDVPQGDNIDGIRFPTFCRSNYRVPNVVHTVEPSDTNTTSVWTDPADLVTATSRGNLLEFRWNRAVSDSANQGGVRIRMPADKLSIISACCSANVQVMPGFAGLVSLDVSTSANVRANFASNNGTTDAPGTIISMEVSTSATAAVEGIAEILSLKTSTSSTTQIKGNVAVLETSTSSKVTVDGSITSGDASTSSKITTSGSCDNVATSTSATCNSNTDTIVEVTVGSPYTASGRTSCSKTSAAYSNMVGGSTVMSFVAASVALTGILLGQ